MRDLLLLSCFSMDKDMLYTKLKLSIRAGYRMVTIKLKGEIKNNFKFYFLNTDFWFELMYETNGIP